MLSMLIYLLVFFAPGITIAAYKKIKLEYVLPVSCIAVILFMFPFGLAGWLHIGVYAEIILAIILYGWTIIRAARKKELFILARNVFTSGMLWFILALLFLTIGIYGKVFDQWDEFSHWGDTIKAAIGINGYSSNPESYSAFQTYPPGMMIFQFLFQKISMMIAGGFIEWKAYFSYNLFVLSFMAPVFSRLSLKKPLYSFACFVSIILLPTIFFNNAYRSIYVELALSIVFAYGLYVVLNKDYLKIPTICCICAILPLLKDAGIILSIIILVLAVVSGGKKMKKKYWLMMTLSFAIPLLAWKINTRISNASEVFPMKYDFAELFRVLFGNGEEYRQTVLKEYPRYLIEKAFVPIGNTGLKINFVVSMGIISVISFFIVPHISDQSDPRAGKCFRIAVPVILLLYTIGLHITYMFQFSEYEAVRFMSLERYLGVAACGTSVFLIYCGTNYLANKMQRFSGIVLAVILFITPMATNYAFLQREYVDVSLQARKEYVAMDEKIRENIDEVSRIFLISQHDNGANFWAMHFLCRPHFMKISQLSNFTGPGDSIGPAFYEGDVWSANIMPEDLRKEWIENYDYVALLHCNAYLEQNYAELFEGGFCEGGLYRIDKEKGIAVLIE